MADEQNQVPSVEVSGDLSRREFVTLSVAAGLAVAAGSGSAAVLRHRNCGASLPFACYTAVCATR
jgi:hypothetical protein